MLLKILVCLLLKFLQESVTYLSLTANDPNFTRISHPRRHSKGKPGDKFECDKIKFDSEGNISQ